LNPSTYDFDPLYHKFCPVVPEICHGQVHVPRKERKKQEEEENNNNNNNNKKRSKNNKSPNVVWETYLSMQSVPITTNVVISNPTNGNVYSIQLYVIKYVSDLQQVGGFLWVPKFPPPIKLTVTI
jgi:hypothetical protein